MLVRAKEACFIAGKYREPGDEFDWKPKNKELCPQCLEVVRRDAPEDDKQGA